MALGVWQIMNLSNMVDHFVSVDFVGTCSEGENLIGVIPPVSLRRLTEYVFKN